MPATLGNRLILGTPLTGARRDLELTPVDRSKHVYVVGSSGQGKSKFLEGLVRQDIGQWPRSKCGLILIDPDGPIFDGVMHWLATNSFLVDRPVIPIDFRRKDFVVSYNPLRPRPDVESSVVVNNFVSAVAHVWGDDSVDKTPLFARYAKSLFQALYERGGSVVDAVFFLDQAERKLRAAMIQDIQDSDSRAAWQYVHDLKPDRFMDELGSTIRRLHPFTYNRFLRGVFGAAGPSLDLLEALEEGQIILVCLSQERGNIDQTDAQLFATTLLADLWQTAGQRGKRDDVKPFYVYIDEFQEYLTPTIATTFARARGYGLHFTLAHQFPSQVKDHGGTGKRIFDSILGNAETVVAFQQKHRDDLALLADRLFGATFDPFKEKLRINTTKVVDYERIILQGSTRSESSGSSMTSAGESLLYDEEGNITGRIENQSSSSGEGATSESTSSHEALAPVLGEELSSVTFLSVEDQRLLAMVALETQGERHAVTRLKNGAPVAFRTEVIKARAVGPHWAETYHLRLLQNLASALPFSQAIEAIEERHHALRRQDELSLDDEAPARRRLRKP